MTDPIVLTLAVNSTLTIEATTSDGGVYVHFEGRTKWLTAATIRDLALTPDQTAYDTNLRKGIS
jgi:hypothetical protein